MARPQKKLDEKQIAQVEALAAFLTLEQIADYFGIVRNTFTAICERQPIVFEHYKKGKAKAIANVAQNLVKQVQDGNTTAQIFYLKTQAGWREQADEPTAIEATPVSITVEVKDARRHAEPEHTTSEVFKPTE